MNAIRSIWPPNTWCCALCLDNWKLDGVAIRLATQHGVVVICDACARRIADLAAQGQQATGRQT